MGVEVLGGRVWEWLALVGNIGLPLCRRLQASYAPCGCLGFALEDFLRPVRLDEGGVGGRVFRPAPVGVDVEMWAQGPPCTVHDRATHGLPQVPSH